MPINAETTPFCVQFHDAVRQSPPLGALRQLGSGLLEREPFSPLKSLLAEGLSHLFESGAVASFGLEADHPVASDVRASLADLIGHPVGNDHFEATAGVSDGLSSILEYCRDTAAGVVLPLPCYFGYELAAIRAGVRIAAYYDAATSRLAWREPGGPLCLVVNTPDAISGHTLDVPRLRAIEEQIKPQLRLTAMDLICAMQRGPTTGDSPWVAELWAGSGAPSRALLLGVTKDLALPGLRAGLVASDDVDLIQHIRRSVLSRSFSAGVFVSMVMALYLHLLRAVDTPTGNHVESGVFPSLTKRVLAELVDHRAKAIAEFEMARRMLERDVPELCLPSSMRHAGYSALATVANGVRDIEAVTDATRQLLTDGLKVNPTYMFGGDPDLWNTLRPGELHLRINLSTPLEDLRRDARTAVRALCA